MLENDHTLIRAYEIRSKLDNPTISLIKEAKYIDFVLAIPHHVDKI